MVFVSILIPCHNARRWVAQAIDSALAQTYAEKEVIVVDDGSTDGSDQVIAGYGDRIRAVRTENRGGNAARNLLLHMARGEWLQYLDADDFLAPGKVAGQMKALAGLPECDVLCAPVTLVHETRAGDAEEEWTFSEPHDPWRLLALWELPQTGAGLWRRAAIAGIGGWDEGRRVCQEADLYLRLLQGGRRFGFTEVGGAYYRQLGGTVSTRDPAESLRQRIAIIDRLEAHLRQAKELTPQRRDAISEGRLACARPLYGLDPTEALRVAGAIRAGNPRFSPGRVSAAYSIAYRTVGFEWAERLAASLRTLRRRLAGRSP